MDSTKNNTSCRNSTYGCTFATSSMVDMVRHFQCDCTFHPVRCFKCNKTVRKVNFAKHYAQFCQDSSAPPCPAPEEAPDVGDAKANTTMSRELHFLQECVRECTLGVESLSHVLTDVAAEVKVTKEKQHDLEAIVKGQCDVIQERSNSITMVVEKVNKVQEDVSGLVNRLEKDVATIVERVENVDGLVKECAKDTKLGVERLSRVMRDVAAEAAEVEAIKETQQGVQAIMKQQGDLIKELGKNILTNAEKINKLEQGVKTIVQGVEKVDGSVFKLEKDVGTIVERVENVDGLVKESAKESKAGVERLSRVIKDVAAEAAEVEAMKQAQQGMQAIMKQQGDLTEASAINIVTNAEKINKVQQGVGTIVQRIEKVDGLVKDVSEIKRSIADQSRVHWYVENVSQCIEKAKTKRSYVVSDMFVVRGYSVKLSFKVDNWGRGLRIGLYFCLCRGPNDSLLQWPFRIPYTMALTHPKDASKTKEHKATPSNYCPEYFEKPKNEENTGAGTRDLCTVEAAQEEGFIENDAVCVSVTLHG